MRILFTSYPLHGHVNPMLPLAIAARDAGHDVAFATGLDMAPHLERWELDVWPVGPTHAEVAAIVPPSPRYFTESAAPRAGDLLPRAAEWAPDVVVADEFELAGQVGAAVLDAPLAVHGLGLMLPHAVWQAAEPTIDSLHAAHGIADGVARVRGGLYLEAAPPSLRSSGERVWRRAQPLRPTPGMLPPGDQLPAALDALPHPDTVHLTLGTLFNDRREVLRTAIEGLRELEANLVVTVGPGADPGDFDPQPAHVLLVDYLPHAQLLPRCRLVVSQGGAGIMLGALAHGLPQLILPQGADQFLNAEACEKVGAALSLAPDVFDAAAVARDASRLLGEPEFAEAAAGVAREIAGMASPRQVLASLSREHRRAA